MQSNTTPDPGHHMGKIPNTTKHPTQNSQEVSPWQCVETLDTRMTNKAQQSTLSSPSRGLQNKNGHKVTHNKT